MPVENHPAIRHRVEKRLTKIEAGVPPHGEPEIPRASQSKRENQPDAHNARRTHPIFSRVVQVHRPEEAGEQNRRRPEADPIRERELRIPSKQKLFEQANENEKHTSELQSL